MFKIKKKDIFKHKIQIHRMKAVNVRAWIHTHCTRITTLMFIRIQMSSWYDKNIAPSILALVHVLWLNQWIDKQSFLLNIHEDFRGHFESEVEMKFLTFGILE